MIAFQGQAAASLEILKDNVDDDDIETCKVARQVTNDCKVTNLDRTT